MILHSEDCCHIFARYQHVYLPSPSSFAAVLHASSHLITYFFPPFFESSSPSLSRPLHRTPSLLLPSTPSFAYFSPPTLDLYSSHSPYPPPPHYPSPRPPDTATEVRVGGRPSPLPLSPCPSPHPPDAATEVRVGG